ncbi:hypothetical protein PAJ34TS1_32070 [Paenibacillus azoreducens]|uniref:Uncharacterized protein n=1 Tax=Paenibacillus azoreducens TaxID=116718 RepID=A0A919YHH7_9BACL|nr:hypothetical protein J34TS1_53590 [Paenibacillus azoreducens]
MEVSKILNSYQMPEEPETCWTDIHVDASVFRFRRFLFSAEQSKHNHNECNNSTKPEGMVYTIPPVR